MGAKHTPGPWTAKDGEVWGDGNPLCFVFHAEAWSDGDPVGSDDQANARLIAAAPDLLAALQSAVQFWDAYRIDDTTQIRAALDAARAAIAKAEGSE